MCSTMDLLLWETQSCLSFLTPLLDPTSCHAPGQWPVLRVQPVCYPAERDGGEHDRQTASVRLQIPTRPEVRPQCYAITLVSVCWDQADSAWHYFGNSANWAHCTTLCMCMCSVMFVQKEWSSCARLCIIHNYTCHVFYRCNVLCVCVCVFQVARRRFHWRGRTGETQSGAGVLCCFALLFVWPCLLLSSFLLHLSLTYNCVCNVYMYVCTYYNCVAMYICMYMYNSCRERPEQRGRGWEKNGVLPSSSEPHYCTLRNDKQIVFDKIPLGLPKITFSSCVCLNLIIL